MTGVMTDTITEMDQLRQRLQRLRASLAAAEGDADTAQAAPPAETSQHAHQEKVSRDTMSRSMMPAGEPSEPFAPPPSVSPPSASSPGNASAAIAPRDTPSVPGSAAGTGNDAGENAIETGNAATIEAPQPSSVIDHPADDDQSARQDDPPEEAPAQAASVPDVVRQLLGMISQPSSVISLQERQLAQDLLAVLLGGHDWHGEEQGICASVVERLCQMPNPPVALLHAVLGCASEEEKIRLGEELRLGDDLLLDLLRQGDGAILAGLLRRRHIPGIVAHNLLEAAPDELIGPLLANEGVVLGEASWHMLLERVERLPKLAAHMLKRADMPRHVALELFWHLSISQRRLFLLRTAGDSQHMKNLLDLALPQAALQRVGREFLVRFDMMLGLLAEGDRLGAAALLAAHCGLHEHTVMRILRDASGEPLAVLFKACGVGLGSLTEVIQAMSTHRKAHMWPWLKNPEHVRESHSILGTNRARMILLYWDWRSRAVGPYRDFPPLAG